METTAFVLILIALILLLLIVGLLAVLIYRMSKQTLQPTQQNQNTEIKHTDTAGPAYHPDVLARFKEAEKIKARRLELFCPNHPEEPGEVSCAVCDHLFCRQCIKPFKALHFCKEHLPLLMNKEWTEVLTVKTSTQDPEQGVRLYDVKKSLFQNENLPSYIETHYKINVDQDFIETYLVMFAIVEDAPAIKEKLSSFTL
jgi:hypothetical protein